jgi:hypothetical protein
MKDILNGKEYNIIEPKEGDIVRVNLHRRMPLPTKRSYFIAIWPSKCNIYEYPNYIEVLCYSINLGELFSYCRIGIRKDTDKFVKPTIGDSFELAEKLRINGFIYDRKSKKVINKKHKL